MAGQTPRGIRRLVGTDPYQLTGQTSGGDLAGMADEVDAAIGTAFGAVPGLIADAFAQPRALTALSTGMDLNNLRESRPYYIRLTNDAATITNRPPVDPGPFILNVLTTPYNQTAQTYYGYFQSGVWERHTINPTGTIFGAWSRLDNLPDEDLRAGVAHSMLVQDFRDRVGPVHTSGRGAVALRFDHGLANFNTKIRPLLEARNLPYSLALNSRSWGLPENTGVTASMVNGWVAGGLAEVWNHGAHHVDRNTTSGLDDTIRGGLMELREQLPAATIDGFAVPGVGGTNYGGFNGGATPQAFGDTAAGRIILRHHAVSSGYIPGTAHRVLDGTLRQGQLHYTLDSMSVSSAIAHVNKAVTDGTGLQLMLHPSVIDGSGNITTAALAQVLDHIVARRDAGALVVLHPTRLAVADRSDGGTIGGGAAAAPASLNANSVDRNIRYSVTLSTGASNLPAGAHQSGLLVTSVLVPTGWRPKIQTYISAHGSPQMWTRYSGSAGWGAWVRLDGTDKLDDGGFIGTTGDLNSANQSGAYGYWSTSANAPSALSGVVWVSQVNNSTTLVQLAVEHGGDRGLYSRFSGTGGWSAWKRLDAGAMPDVPSIAPPQSSAGFRTVPLALTVGGSGAAGPTSGIMRMPVRFGARINRWRVHFRNNNPRFGADGSAVSIAQVYFGAATAGAFTATPTLIASDRTTATVTPWQNTPIEAGTEYALSYSFSTAGTTNRVVGGGWSSSHVSSTSATLTPVTSMPLDAWIEAEIAPDVPVIAAFGDSLSSGVGATLPVFDSWPSIYCRRIGALPVHYTASGDTMAGWSDPLAYKWARWRHLSRPDAVIHAMGSNDVFGGATLGEMQARRAATMKILSELVTPVIASATILPRSNEAGATEDVRRSYNAWLKTSPDEARDLYDMVPPISGDDENISPGFDSGDGVHLNASGYTQMQTAITRALVPTPA